MRIHHITAAACLAALTACNSSTPKAMDGNQDSAMNIQADNKGNMDVQPISGYFVKNSIQPADSLTFWLIDNQQSFDSLFGMAKTMNNTIDKPDFGTRLVVAATMPATYYGTQIQLESATIDNVSNNAEMHFVAPAKTKNSYSVLPLWLGTIPKTGKTTIKFYTGDQLTATITTPE
ncbi:hypothetical protein ECE50_022335 [Chitinophaga sp. Mgbs1]|uniref:Uncharacterized protein n=1 Tax=Chitinophaga solisilvae TaxID=1233460 RepID=A0A3S1CZL4_9BACT|nr:hypothetical protein [Chitinophaga solisilvae]